MMLQLMYATKWITPLYTHKKFPAINGTFRLMSDKCKKGGKYLRLFNKKLMIA